MCSKESICENKKDMDDSGFDMSAQDASMCSQRVNLLDLSDDVLLYILRHCTPRDLKALGYSCPRLGRLVRERSLWRRVDARSEACTRSRLQWLLENVLHADTQVLLLTGYARDTDGCMGLVDITRKMAEQEAKERDAETALNGHTTLEAITTNLANMRGMERHPARFYISAQRTQLRRHHCSPAWPEDGDGKEEGRAGPQRCIGPQYTVSEGLLLQLAAKCPQLTTLWLEYCNIDCSNTCLGAFPKSLKKLSLRGTKCYNMTFDKSFLFKVQDYLPILESLDVSECEWMDPATMLPLSKMPRLEELVMQDCYRLTEFVAYASLTARYGFKTLKSLDLRGSPVGDSEVSALGWLPRLEKLWLSARCKKRPPPHSHFVDDERTDHAQLPEWECQEPDYYKDKSDPFTSIEDIESGMGEPMTSSDIADDEADNKNERFSSQDAKGSKDSKEDEKDKKGSKRKPDKDDDDDDLDDNGEPSPKQRRTGVKISFENNTITKRVLPVIQNEDGFCVFDESDEAYNGNGENIVIRNNVNENNADNNNEQRNGDNIAPPNFEFNLINPMGSIDVGNVEIDFSLVNVDDLRENLRNDNNRNNANNGNRNDNGVNEGRRRCASDGNRENPPNNDDRGCLVDCIKIDRLIDVSNAACDRQNEVIVIASSSRPTNEPSTSKQPDDNKKTENTKKPEPQGYVHFRRFQNPVYVNVNRDESDDNNENEKIKENNGNRPRNVGEVGKDCESKTDDKMEVDENKSEKGDDKGKSDDAKPGTSDKQINEGASTSKDGQNAPKDKPPADNNPRVPLRRSASNNERRREPLPPVQYQIEQRHHVLYVGLGAQLNTYRFPRDPSELLRHFNLARTHLEGSGLVTDFAMRRFGRADGEDVNVIHIGPDGPMLVGQATGSRPDRSSLRFLSVTGYRNITDRSLTHLATAAPNLAFIDFSGTSVTEVGVESFRSLRPDCDIVYSQFNEHWPSNK